MEVGVFHKIGEPTPDHFTHSIEQILAFDGVVTFDGVYESVFEHRVALESKRPIIFISGNQIGREGFCNLEQLAELRYYGFMFGWHGWSHRKLTELSDDEVRAELRVPTYCYSKLYAYPHGDFDDRVRQLVADAGFVQAYSTTQGNDDPLSLRRIYV